MRRWFAQLRRRPPLLNAKDAYARWAATYPSRTHTALMRLEHQAVLDLLPHHIDQSALDLACGSGRYISVLSDRGAGPVVGLDFSAPMLRQVSQLRKSHQSHQSHQSHFAHQHSTHLVQANCLALPFASASFTVVVCGLALGHIQDLSRAVAEIGRVLTPGGLVIYSDLHPLGALLGWQRTFQSPEGQTYAIEHYSHLYADHHHACRTAQLDIEAVSEPLIDFSHPWQGYPAALVIRARKSASSAQFAQRA